MKKFLALLMLTAITTAVSFAQAPVIMRSQTMIIKNNVGTNKTADTLTNTDTNYIGYRCTYPYDLALEYTFTKLSGYMRATAKLQGSNDTSGALSAIWYTVIRPGAQAAVIAHIPSQTALRRSEQDGKYLKPGLNTTGLG